MSLETALNSARDPALVATQFGQIPELVTLFQHPRLRLDVEDSGRKLSIRGARFEYGCHPFVAGCRWQPPRTTSWWFRDPVTRPGFMLMRLELDYGGRNWVPFDQDVLLRHVAAWLVGEEIRCRALLPAAAPSSQLQNSIDNQTRGFDL